MRKTTWRRTAFSLAASLGVAAAVVLTAGSPAEASRPLARAVLHNAAGAEIGEVVFKGDGTYANRVEVQLELPAGAPGLGSYHGFHVHTIGACVAPSFGSAGGHWNLVAGATHGHHTGDLPSVLLSSDGTAYAEFETHRFDVTQLFDADGSAVVLHAGADNFANVPLGPGRYQDPDNWYNAPTGTANTGDAGGRYGCGVVQPE
jgi:superoxide dismutase, Cu-Zn family